MMAAGFAELRDHVSIPGEKYNLAVEFLPFNHAQSIDEHGHKFLDEMRSISGFLQLLENGDDDIIVDAFDI